MTREGSGAARLGRILLCPSSTGQAPPAPQPSFGDTREPASLVPLLVTASSLAQETRTWQEWEETVGKSPACPSSLSRHPWCAQNLQLLQIVFGTTVPAVKQSLHWIKKWPYLALSPHRSQELKQCLDGSSARVASVQALFPLSPPCPTTHLPQGSTACSHISGSSHCHSGFPKKRTSGLVLFFPGEEYF